MTERKEFEMTLSQLDSLIAACQPQPAIALHCGPVLSVQERANAAWNKLGDEMGFDGMTVRPVPGKSVAYFTAVPK